MKSFPELAKPSVSPPRPSLARAVGLWFRVLPVVLALSAFPSGAGVRVSGLRCESLTDPRGIDVLRPRLSWVLESAERGQRQSAYRVLVARSAARLARDEGDLWDSGRVTSDRSVHVPYDGDALVSRTEAHWKVRCWDKDGRPSDWSAPAVFSMGLLEPGDWQGQWIGRDDPPAPPAANPLAVARAQWIWHPGENGAGAAPLVTRYFRRVFHLPADRGIVRAELLLAGDNEFAVAVNGQHAGAGGNFKVAGVMDVTRSVRVGPNLIAAWVKNAGDAPNPAGLIGRLRVEFSGGGSLDVPTGTGWTSFTNDVPGWTLPGFDDAAWPAAAILGDAGMAPWGEIGVGDEDRRLAARMLRREFQVSRPVRRATLYVSGLGLSEVYLNGHRIGDHVLSPGLTEYTKRVFYVTHDVTGAVRPGDNALGVWLGNGRYYAPRGKVPTETLNYGFPKLLLQLEVELADGTRQVVASDATWKLTADGPITENNEYDGETYDARREMPGWDRPGFDDCGWDAAARVTPPGGRLVAPMTEPIRVTENLQPLSVKEPTPGVFVYDLGQNMVGWCRLKVSGPAGTTVRLRHAEVLRDDGTLYLDNLRSARVTDTYTLKGGGEEIYEPRFTYHGFRFVEVTGYPGRPGLDAIEGRVVHDDVAGAGEWSSSKDLLNRLWRHIRWGVRGNYRSVPTDCPQRDERQGWLGDRSVESRGEAYLFDIEALYRKWVRDMADAQKASGSVPDVCPPYWPIYSDNVTWPSSTVIIPGMLWDLYGDTRTIAVHYESMRRWVDYMQGFVTHGVMARDTYGDWCVPPEDPKLIHSADPARKTHPEILASGYFLHDLRLMARYARTLGRMADARRFEEASERLQAALHARHYRPGEGWYDNGSQTACLLPLALGIVPEAEAPRVMARLRAKIVDETHRHVGTGLIGGQWLMRTLTARGEGDLAYTMATQTTYPSWGYMDSRGATTIWELWNGDTADPAMNSGNHVMLVGDLVIWLYEALAGIAPDPAEPGFRRIDMRPHPLGDLRWVRASFRSPYGEIRSHWQRDATRFEWRVAVPPNTAATLRLPVPASARVIEGGKAIESSPGIRGRGYEAGRLVLDVGPGEYQFVARWPADAE